MHKKSSVTVEPSRTKGEPKGPSPSMGEAFLLNRLKLLSFFRARGQAEAADDLMQELWLALPKESAEIAAPLAYMYTIANSLILKRYRRDRQSVNRDTQWIETTGPTIPGCSDQPSADRIIAGRQMVKAALTACAGEGERVARIFQRHVIDGIPQRDVAAELGVSLGTVEADLRRARRALAELRTKIDESLL